jgi:hypothetical protein
LSSAGSGVAKLGGSIGRAAVPAVLSVMAAASAPLAGRPKVVRDTVGWIAIWTAFLSLSLWTYLLFFHRAEVPRSDSAPIEIVGSERGAGARPHAEEAAGAGEAGSADAKDRAGGAGH